MPTTSIFCRLALLAMILSAAACSRSPKTITMKTPDGKQEIPAPLPATLFSMALVMESQGRHDESEALLRQIVIGHPEYVPAYYELSNQLSRRQRLDDALLVLQAGLKEAPNDPILLNNAGMCHLLRKDYKKALDYFKDASKSDPADNRYKANQALVLAMQGKTDDARALYSSFLTPEQAAQNLKIIEKTRLSEGAKKPASGEKK